MYGVVCSVVYVICVCGVVGSIVCAGTCPGLEQWWPGDAVQKVCKG